MQELDRSPQINEAKVKNKTEAALLPDAASWLRGPLGVTSTTWMHRCIADKFGMDYRMLSVAKNTLFMSYNLRPDQIFLQPLEMTLHEWLMIYLVLNCMLLYILIELKGIKVWSYLHVIV